MAIEKKYPLVMTNSLLLKMAIEIVSFPMKNGDVQSFFVCLPEVNMIQLSTVRDLRHKKLGGGTFFNGYGCSGLTKAPCDFPWISRDFMVIWMGFIGIQWEIMGLIHPGMAL